VVVLAVAPLAAAAQVAIGKSTFVGCFQAKKPITG
jgi:hypothetical protein